MSGRKSLHKPYLMNTRKDAWEIIPAEIMNINKMNEKIMVRKLSKYEIQKKISEILKN